MLQSSHQPVHRSLLNRAALSMSLAAAIGVSLCPLVPATAGGPLPSAPVNAAKTQAAGAVHGWIPAKEFTAEDGLRGDIQVSDAAPVKDPLKPGDGAMFDTDASEQMPALSTELRFDGAGQKAVWSGRVDPSREVQLLAYNTDTDRYEVLGSSRGEADRTIRVEGALKEQNNVDGKAKVIVLGTDPFADDLRAPVKDSFEDPSEYDFSLVHLTDTQYLTEGATHKPNAAERKVWALSLIHISEPTRPY